MKDENKNPSEEKIIKSIEVAKEKLAELDDDQLENLAGGTDHEQATASGCSCQSGCNTTF
ncbi:hypothetical protein [Dyadobacter pollutisoli]|jgi:natural product precursor|uniref:Uncharacterized protein n=1 Tax=Dyadobacter pollutisoli TaxID=2910158 RepID=A0A9E8NFC3_9BACT|nr:hypothetical protein [Dyadobacter pollutisoli]WAC14918.1 hypothetical protein ON006_13325 [Dyadobacter pollutisoli]